MLRIGTKGWRLLAALRQLGGVRRGIEIANAHYGYFPIEGRMPPSFSLSLSLPLSYALLGLSHSVRPLPPPTPRSPSRDLSSSCCRLRSLSSPRSFTSHTQFVLSHRYLTLSHHIFAYSRIAPMQLSPSCSRVYVLSLFVPYPLSPESCAFLWPLFLAQNGNAHAGDRTRSRSHFPLFHSCLSLIFPLSTSIVFPPRSIFSPRHASLLVPLLSRFLALFSLCSLIYPSSIFCPVLFFPHPFKQTRRILVTSIVLRATSPKSRIRFVYCDPMAHPITFMLHPLSLIVLALSSPTFIVVTLSLAPAYVFSCPPATVIHNFSDTLYITCK